MGKQNKVMGVYRTVSIYIPEPLATKAKMCSDQKWLFCIWSHTWSAGDVSGLWVGSSSESTQRTPRGQDQATVFISCRPNMC